MKDARICFRSYWSNFEKAWSRNTSYRHFRPLQSFIQHLEPVANACCEHQSGDVPIQYQSQQAVHHSAWNPGINHLNRPNPLFSMKIFNPMQNHSGCSLRLSLSGEIAEWNTAAPQTELCMLIWQYATTLRPQDGCHDGHDSYIVGGSSGLEGLPYGVFSELLA